MKLIAREILKDTYVARLAKKRLRRRKMSSLSSIRNRSRQI